MTNKIKYSFLLPYYDRHIQFIETLESFLGLYKGRNDYEVVIVEDAKNVADPIKHALFIHLINMFATEIPIRHVRYPLAVINPVGMFNMAAKLAQGEYFILSSPECRHETNVLAGLDEEFAKNPNAYVVCACQALKADGTFHMWYQHSIHRNAKYHFCSAISKDQFDVMGGFEEAYQYGYCFDDDDFRDRIIHSSTPVVVCDDLLVSHQWHSKAYRPSNWKLLWEKNKKIYEAKFGKYVEQ